MKPKDLKSPYTWEERRPLIQDRVFFIPTYYKSHASFQFPRWSDEQIFSSDASIKIEFCSGNGDWILKQAQKEPEANWVACEIQFDRVRKIWSKLKNENLSNLFVVAGDGRIFATNYLSEDSVDEVYINFPDPWPKKRHEKNRLLQPPFINELHRILKEGGKVTFVTDDRSYMESTLNLFLQSGLFVSKHGSPHYVNDISGYGTSYFDTLWREIGKEIYFLEFQKKGVDFYLPQADFKFPDKKIAKIKLPMFLKSTLNWKKERQEALEACERDFLILWEFDLGLFNELTLPLEDEAQLLSLQLALKHFSETLFLEFTKDSYGACIYHGKILRVREEIDYLLELIAELPDELKVFLSFENNTPPDLFKFLSQEGSEHFYVLHRDSFPYAQEKVSVALVLPNEELKNNWQKISKPFKVIPERLLTHEWEGIDTLFIPAELSPQGRRKIAGFLAAGGEVVYLETDS